MVLPELPDDITTKIQGYNRDLSMRCPPGFKIQPSEQKNKMCIPFTGPRSEITMYCCKEKDTCFQTPHMKSVLITLTDPKAFKNVQGITLYINQLFKDRFHVVWDSGIRLRVSVKNGKDLDIFTQVRPLKTNIDMHLVGNDKKRNWRIGCMEKFLTLLKKSTIPKTLHFKYDRETEIPIDPFERKLKLVWTTPSKEFQSFLEKQLSLESGFFNEWQIVHTKRVDTER